MITHRNPDATSFSFFTLPATIDVASRICGQAGIVISWSMRTERALLGWVAVNNRLCATQLDVLVAVG